VIFVGGSAKELEVVSECEAKGFSVDDGLLLGEIGQEYTTC